MENDEKVKMDEIETNEKVEIDYGEISTTGRWTKILKGEIFGKQANVYEA